MSFLSYKNNCPICSSELNVLLHSRRKQKCIKYYDYVSIIFDLKDLYIKDNSHKIIFNFYYNNKLEIQFANKNGNVYKNPTEHILNKFKQLNENLKQYNLFVYCDKCKCYCYESDDFTIDPNLLKCDLDIIVSYESFSLYKESGEYKYTYHISNDYSINKSYVDVLKIDKSLKSIGTTVELNLDIISFTNSNYIMNRIDKLITFI
jgi:hypothetical protein